MIALSYICFALAVIGGCVTIWFSFVPLKRGFSETQEAVLERTGRYANAFLWLTLFLMSMGVVFAAAAGVWK